MCSFRNPTAFDHEAAETSKRAVRPSTEISIFLENVTRAVAALDWDATIARAEHERLAPILYVALRGGAAPAPVLARLRAAWMAAAGPAANLVLAGIGFATLKIGLATGAWGVPTELPLDRLVATAGTASVMDGLGRMASVLFSLNLILFLFNLIPLPPMDGATVLSGWFARTLPGGSRLARLRRPDRRNHRAWRRARQRNGRSRAAAPRTSRRAASTARQVAGSGGRRSAPLRSMRRSEVT